ncbi:MAG TPA: ATP-binding cassette domain-containing protein [Streptosporangiaceae bacterium]|nr:ATP-binding cassette domain-containing protein [Streptosporangiaceae bacterium]
MPGALLGAELSRPFRLPPHLLAALVPVLILFAALTIFCLVDLYRAESVRGLPKIAWALIIVLVSWPIGALVYLFAGRDRGRPRRPTPQPAAGASGTSGAIGTAGTGAGSRAAPAADAGVPETDHAGPGAVPATSVRAATAGQPAVPGDAPEHSRPVVTTTDLTRDYGGTGLFDVGLRVPDGCIYGLVGPNGAGKTTLLSILSGIRRADRGSVTWSIDRSQIAVCPDVPEFDGWLTGYEIVDLARSLVAPESGRQDVLAALRAAGLAEDADRRVSGYSRGMVQRLGLACALVGDPRLLILDEPTSALDPAGRADILNLVAAMRGSRTVIFSSHILADVQRIADRVGILRDGRLLYQGATGDLIDTYLRPAWLVRIAGQADQVAAAITDQPWATRVELAGADSIRVDAVTIEAGERGIPAAIAACGARQVSCEPVAADLESAFLALTSSVAGEAS